MHMKRGLPMNKGRSRHIVLQCHQLGYPELMDIIIIIRPVLNVLATRPYNINHRQVITIIPSKCVAADPVTAIFRIKWCLSLTRGLSHVNVPVHFLLHVWQHSSSSRNHFEHYEMFTVEYCRSICVLMVYSTLKPVLALSL